jgi:NTP pyrophosphatase (non-canonical NTP hydrolase)
MKFLDKNKKEEIIQINIKVNSKKWILSKLAEECNELSLAILQHLNKNYDENNIIKEIADVETNIEHLRYIYNSKLIDIYKNKKYIRIMKRLRKKFRVYI